MDTPCQQLTESAPVANLVSDGRGLAYVGGCSARRVRSSGGMMGTVLWNGEEGAHEPAVITLHFLSFTVGFLIY
jgi:hypothetical protein